MRATVVVGLLVASGCKSGKTCAEDCTEGVTITLDAEQWRDGLHEINAIYTTDGREHEVWCGFTLPEADDAHCSIDMMEVEAPALEVGETVLLEIPGTPPSIDITLYDAWGYVERYELRPEYVDNGCTESCKVAMLSASFAEPQSDAGAE